MKATKQNRKVNEDARNERVRPVAAQINPQLAATR